MPMLVYPSSRAIFISYTCEGRLSIQRHSVPRVTVPVLRDLLKLVDTTRDEVLPGLGVQVQDQSLEECTWMLLPTNRRHDRRKPNEEQDTPSLDADSEDGGSSASGHR